jgi:exportin-2 (importin alpha re-exporter)
MLSCRRDSFSRAPSQLTLSCFLFSFKPEDTQPFSGELIDTILTKLESAGSPEKVAENDFMMKCEQNCSYFLNSGAHKATSSPRAGIMRVIFTARQTLAATTYDRILQRLVGILGATSKNPSNPNFDQYLFESLSGLIRQVGGWRSGSSLRLTLLCRFVAAANPATVPVFERQLFGPFTFILQQDIDRERGLFRC